MHNGKRWCAVAAALFLGLAGVQAQEPTTAAHLAAAKIAEGKGDFAAAETELGAALAVASGDDRTRVEEQLRALLQKLGKEEGKPGPQAQWNDPVQRCILALDGSAESDAVAKLGSLGRLVVPQLLAALPRLGPFGVRNAVRLLGAVPDERARDALLHAIDTGDQAVIAAIEQTLSRMVREMALPLAERLADADVVCATKLAALQVLLNLDPERGGAEVAAMALTAPETASVHERLLAALDRGRPTWQKSVLAALWQHGGPAVRAEVLRQRILIDSTLSEDEVLAEFDTIGEGGRVHAADGACQRHPDWIRLGVKQLEAAMQCADAEVGAIIRTWEWWRAPDIAAPTLFAEANRGRRAYLWEALPAMVQHGWRIPLALEDAVAAVAGAHGTEGWRTFVLGMPEDAEARAVALMDRIGDPAAGGLAFGVAAARRPWRRLVAHWLANAPDIGGASELLSIDWIGASGAAVADLVAFARRYPRLRHQLRGQPFDGALISAFGRTPDLPADFMLPLLDAGWIEAWDALAARDPKSALAWAARADRLDATMAERAHELLIRCGGDADVPLAVRLCRMGVFPGEDGGGNLVNFVGEHGGGELEAIRLGEAPLPVDDFTMSWCLRAAEMAAQGARHRDLTALLELLPRLQVAIAIEVHDRLEQLRPGSADVGAFGAALARAVAASPTHSHEVSLASREVWGSVQCAVRLCRTLAGIGDAAALPALRQAMASSEPLVRSAAASAALQVAGPGKRALVVEMLGSQSPDVVGAALREGDFTGDAELRDAAATSLLRVAGAACEVDEFFRKLPVAARVDLARRVLAAPDCPQFGPPLLQAALGVLGRQKDGALVADMIRLAAHPDEGIRHELAAQLGNTFAREAAPPLLEMLKDDSASVRLEAKNALAQIAGYLDEREQWEKRFGR
ncbi:MAG: HEAT repeat domain-containing protein [Planctomycetota bacterium]